MGWGWGGVGGGEKERVDDLVLTNYDPLATVEGKARIAIGKGKLLIGKRLPQFAGLCQQNIRRNSGQLDESDDVVTNQDLAGFWDLVSLAVDDVNEMFAKLATLREANWDVAALGRPPTPESKPKPVSGRGGEGRGGRTCVCGRLSSRLSTNGKTHLVHVQRKASRVSASAPAPTEAQLAKRKAAAAQRAAMREAIKQKRLSQQQGGSNSAAQLEVAIFTPDGADADRARDGGLVERRNEQAGTGGEEGEAGQAQSA